MTIYAGEYVQIAVSISGQKIPGKFEILTPEDIDNAKISVWSENGRQIVVEGQVDYDALTGLWKFYWDTSGLFPGRYEYRCTFFGEGERRTWEEGFVVLHRSVRPVTMVVPE